MSLTKRNRDVDSKIKDVIKDYEMIKYIHTTKGNNKTIKIKPNKFIEDSDFLNQLSLYFYGEYESKPTRKSLQQIIDEGVAEMSNNHFFNNKREKLICFCGKESAEQENKRLKKEIQLLGDQIEILKERLKYHTNTTFEKQNEINQAFYTKS